MSEAAGPVPEVIAGAEQTPFVDRTDDSVEARPGYRSGGSHAGIWLAWIALFGLFTAVNCVALPFTENATGRYDAVNFVIALGIGLIGGQIGVLSAMLVWSNHPFLPRLVGLWAIAAVLYGCWLLGLVIAIQDNFWMSDMMFEVARAVAASLPLASLAVQLPQWFLRLYLGWRIERPELASKPAARPALSIRDIMIGTTIAALTLTAIRFALADAEDMGPPFWLGWAIAMGILLAVSSLVYVPLLLLILRSDQPGWALAFLLLGPPAIVGTLVGFIALFIEKRPPPGNALMMMLTAGTMCVATTSAPLWLWRLAGYRLKMGREE